MPCGPQHLEEPGAEHIGQPPRDGVLVPQAVQFLEPAVPPDDPVVAVDDGEAVVQRFEDVLAEFTHALELIRLHVQLTVEPAVLERGRRLRGHGGEQRHVLAAQGLGAGPAAEREHRDRAFL